MEYEQTFRFILILGFAAIVPIGAYHRVKSQATGEKLDRRQEGIFILVTLRPIGWTSLIGLVTYMINPVLMAWSSGAPPSWLRWAGVVLGITGGLLLGVTFRTLGKNLTDTARDVTKAHPSGRFQNYPGRFTAHLAVSSDRRLLGYGH